MSYRETLYIYIYYQEKKFQSIKKKNTRISFLLINIDVKKIFFLKCSEESKLVRFFYMEKLS